MAFYVVLNDPGASSDPEANVLTFNDRVSHIEHNISDDIVMLRDKDSNLVDLIPAENILYIYSSHALKKSNCENEKVRKSTINCVFKDNYDDTH